MELHPSSGLDPSVVWTSRIDENETKTTGHWLTGVDDVLTGHSGVINVVNRRGKDRRHHLNICEHVLQQQQQQQQQQVGKVI